MKYENIIKNIVVAINTICIKKNFNIDIYHYGENIEFDITDENNSELIYRKSFVNSNKYYIDLINELINIFNTNDSISKLIINNHQISQQNVYIENLEFHFMIDNSNFEEVKTAQERHQQINNRNTDVKKIRIKKTKLLNH